MNNLKDIYNKINEELDALYDFDMMSGYQELVRELSKSIEMLGEFFGVRMLNRDIGPFKKNEMVCIEQDESGAWLRSIDFNDKRNIDLYDHLNENVDDWFYPVSEEKSGILDSACEILEGKKTVVEATEDFVNKLEKAIAEELRRYNSKFDF